MGKTIPKLLFSIIKNEVFEKNDIIKFADDAQIVKTLSLSKRYDLSCITSCYVLDNVEKISSQIRSFCEREKLLCISRYERIAYELNRLREIFKLNKIKFIPLKGAVIRDYYSKPWQRTSCDIDILIKEDDLKNLKDILCSAGFIYKPREMYVLKFESESGIDVEMHYSLMGKYNKQTNDLLDNVWQYAKPIDDSETEYVLNNEFFMFYNLAHTSKHFECGCGVRPFIDLKILNQYFPTDEKVFDEMLNRCGLAQFYKYSSQLAETWFGDMEHDELTLLMEDFILDGGVYGSLENKTTVSQIKDKGKKGFVKSRLFLTYTQLSGFYPVLKKHKWLTPLFQIVRWFKVFRKGKLKRSVIELSVNNNTNAEKLKDTQKMLDKLNLL